MLISRSIRLWKITYVRLINWSFHFSTFCFLIYSQYLLLFLKSLRSCVLLSTLLHPSSVLQRHHEEGNLFLEYDQSNWFFLHRFLFIIVLFSSIRSRIRSIETIMKISKKLIVNYSSHMCYVR